MFSRAFLMASWFGLWVANCKKYYNVVAGNIGFSRVKLLSILDGVRVCVFLSVIYFLHYNHFIYLSIISTIKESDI